MQTLALLLVYVYNVRLDFYLIDWLFVKSNLTHSRAFSDHAISKVPYVRRPNNECRRVSESIS